MRSDVREVLERAAGNTVPRRGVEDIWERARHLRRLRMAVVAALSMLVLASSLSAWVALGWSRDDALAPVSPDATEVPIGPDGRIAFVSAGDIWSINPDGTGRRRLTEKMSASDPNWSPDGTRIAFSGGSGDIFTMNADGSDLVRLTPGGDINVAPAWSPDGTRIAFLKGSLSADEAGHVLFAIYVMDADGSGPTRIRSAAEPEMGSIVRWSLDGTELIFYGLHHEAGPSGPSYGLNAVEVESGKVRRPYPPRDLGYWESTPTHSRDGARIAFHATGEGTGEEDCTEDRYGGTTCTTQIYVMKVDGTDLERLTGHPAGATDPTWSADGARIAFVSKPDKGNREIYVMNSDGSNVTRLTHPLPPGMPGPRFAGAHSPAWSPVP